jgi:hypothetical protein
MAIQTRFICDGCTHTVVSEADNPPDWYERKVIITISDGVLDNKVHEGKFDLCSGCRTQLVHQCNPATWPRPHQEPPWFDEKGMEHYGPPPGPLQTQKHLDPDYDHSPKWLADRLRDSKVLER